MATVSMVDRRKAVPKKADVNSFWVTSEVFGYADADKGVLLFVFPEGEAIAADRHTPYGVVDADGLASKFGETYVVEQVAVEIDTALDGTTPTIDVGVGTIADIEDTTTDNITYTNDDDLMANTEVTEGTPGIYFCKFDGSSAAITHVKETITCDDDPVPCIFAHIQSGDTDMTAGAAKVHVKLTRLGDAI